MKNYGSIIGAILVLSLLLISLINSEDETLSLVIIVFAIIIFVAYGIYKLDKSSKDDEIIETETRKRKMELDEKNKQQVEFRETINSILNNSNDFQTYQNFLENFMSKVPSSIFLNAQAYHHFEKRLLSDYPIGKLLIWSSHNELSKEYIRTEELDDFFSGDFANMVRFLTIKSNEIFTNSISAFVILQFLQKRASNWHGIHFETSLGIQFENIEHLTLRDCAYAYYRKCQNSLINIFDDPQFSLLTHFLINHNKFNQTDEFEYHNYLKRRNEIKDYIMLMKDEFNFMIFEESMNKAKNSQKYTIEDIDLLDGFEFENMVARIFTSAGFRTEVTKHSSDFGIDVIAEKNEMKIGIQAKCYVGVVSNKAIQEVVAGMKYYKCNKGIVVTNSTFTKAAIQLARSNSIELWDRPILIEKLKDL